MEKKYRFRFFGIIIFLMFAASYLLYRYVDVMLFDNVTPLRISYADPLVERGPIFDQNGKILAIQNQASRVTAWIPRITDFSETARILADTLSLDETKLLEGLEASNRHYTVKRKITKDEERRIVELINSRALQGIYLEPDTVRHYPENDLVSHLVGYVNVDSEGLDGVEYTYNHYLSPNPRTDFFANDATIVYGNEVHLTLDVNMQYAIHQIAAEAMREHNPDFLGIIVADAKTGAILSYVSLPTYDANHFNLYSNDLRNNKMATYAYEPGSVFKVFSLAAMIELGDLHVTNSFRCTGEYRQVINEDLTIVINCLTGHGSVRALEIIKYSCNAGTAYASELTSATPFYNKLREFGFGARTEMPFPGETAGIFRHPNQWSVRSKQTIAIGQEISVSALQVISAASTLSNSGIRLQPYIIDKVVSPDGKIIEQNSRTPLNRVLSADVANAMLLMMESSTEAGGTAWRMKTPGIRISAKTGTAEVIDPLTGTYSSSNFLASTLAILPTDDPQLILYAFVSNPKGPTIYGARITAPILKEVLHEIAPYLGLSFDRSSMLTHPGRVTVDTFPPLQIGEYMPNLLGFSKRELLPMFSDNLNILLQGEGWVVKQNPLPGSIIEDGMTIFLELE